VAQLLNFIGRSQRYVVNETQKAEIAAALRRQQRLTLYLAPILFLIPFAFAEP